VTEGGTRRGIVLGAGGVLGAAWTIGALKALEDHTGFDPRAADVIIGTSAGSVVGSALGGGIDVSMLVPVLFVIASWMAGWLSEPT